VVRVEVGIVGDVGGGDNISWGTGIRKRVLIVLELALVWFNNSTTEISCSVRYYNSNVMVVNNNDLE
jgi:hypothetical protein